jgi:hypothetical protein
VSAPVEVTRRRGRRALLAADQDGYARLTLGQSILRVHRRTLLLAAVLAVAVVGLALVAMK